MPKVGNYGYISYIDLHYSRHEVKRYIPVDTPEEVRLYLSKLQDLGDVLEVTFHPRHKE